MTTLFGHTVVLTLVSKDTIAFEINGVKGKFVEAVEFDDTNAATLW